MCRKITRDVSHKMLIAMFILSHELLYFTEFRKRSDRLIFDLQLKKAAIVKPKERVVGEVTMHDYFSQSVIIATNHQIHT